MPKSEEMPRSVKILKGDSFPLYFCCTTEVLPRYPVLAVAVNFQSTIKGLLFLKRLMVIHSS